MAPYPWSRRCRPTGGGLSCSSVAVAGTAAGERFTPLGILPTPLRPRRGGDRSASPNNTRSLECEPASKSGRAATLSSGAQSKMSAAAPLGNELADIELNRSADVCSGVARDDARYAARSPRAPHSN